MATTREASGLLWRRPKTPEITTPPTGTVLPAHARTGAPDVPVTSVTPALPPGWVPAADAPRPLPGVPRQATRADRPLEPMPADRATVLETPKESPKRRTPKAPTIPLQINALQAMCRQVFAFRLAMIALAAPAALLNAAPGIPTRLVGAAVVVTFMGSYVLYRDWERFGPLLLRHPTLLAADTLLGSLLLISAGPDTTLAYVSVCTPLLAGIVYSWRGAACFASLQSLILLLVSATTRDLHANLAESLLLPGLCVIAGAVGSSLRNLMLRFGTATQALTQVQARLAVTEAVSAERARLAREMHDSVAKTLHGVALAADGLAASADADRIDAPLIRQQADLVSRSARRAAAESRELLTDLRREHDPDHGTDILADLAAHTADFTTRTGLPTTYRPTTPDSAPQLLPPAVARQLLTIAAEALENAHRHAQATRVEVTTGVRNGLLTLTVHDDGRGLPTGTTLEQLRQAGHFGLVGMVERAASVGARIRIGRGAHPHGTEVHLELPLAALPSDTA
ncbi:histidine kinase [Streptomyces sp. CA-249302]|uniref:sensor histidine kinase n=1 Tax=Streptomyces sp. CA-249302 TaxID=3240058 RepID=UPI003D93B9C6